MENFWKADEKVRSAAFRSPRGGGRGAQPGFRETGREQKIHNVGTCRAICAAPIRTCNVAASPRKPSGTISLYS